MSVCHPDWRDEALCRGLTRLFFPKQGEDVRPAKAVCQQCPVQEPCLSQGLHERYGIWAGTSERERRHIRGAA